MNGSSQIGGHVVDVCLDGFVKTQEWRARGDDERREFLKDTFEDFRATGRDALKQRYSELLGGHDDDLPPLPAGFVVAK